MKTYSIYSVRFKCNTIPSRMLVFYYNSVSFPVKRARFLFTANICIIISPGIAAYLYRIPPVGAIVIHQKCDNLGKKKCCQQNKINGKKSNMTYYYNKSY